MNSQYSEIHPGHTCVQWTCPNPDCKIQQNVPREHATTGEYACPFCRTKAEPMEAQTVAPRPVAPIVSPIPPQLQPGVSGTTPPEQRQNEVPPADASAAAEAGANADQSQKVS